MRLAWILILTAWGFLLRGQSWQQQTDYSIQCRLDDQTHQLQATMQIEYHNNSPHDLASFMIHTWMNTFSSSGTPYSKQLSGLGMDHRFRLKAHEQGGYSNLLFKYKGREIPYQFTDHTHEIIEVQLPERCKSGQKTTLDITYTLNLPKNVSRGGHLGQSYQLTQWYPKIALYDEMGWHTMHYLELGEYFNDFGDYEVSIELPSNYLVASTGSLEDEAEKKRLIGFADSCKQNSIPQPKAGIEFPVSNTDFKKLKFSARQVIDFAWFADKRFWVNHSILFQEGKPVDLWAFFYPKPNTIWNQATTYLSSAVSYFNHLVGAYPYPQITAVECPRDGSDAMEYPMITLIDRYYSQPLELEKVIVHEAGHNWFQAILATDERKEGWMDEGMVTYYEHRYFRDRPSGGMFGDAPFPLHTDYDHSADFDWYIQANRNQDKPPAGRADHFTIREYIQSIYEKPAKGLHLMENVLSTATFDQVIKSYYNQWKFRHPRSADLMDIFRRNGIKWYDSLYILSPVKVDCSIERIASGPCFKIRHEADFTFPVELTGYRKNNPVWNRKMNISPVGDTICINPDSLDYLVVDPSFYLPEINRSNNIIRLNTSPYIPKKFAFRFLGGIDHSLTREAYILPAISYNFYDGVMAGVAVHNLSLPTKSFRYAGMLGYGLRSKNPVWIGGIDYTHRLISNKLDHINLGFETRYFTFNRDSHYLTNDQYFKWAPSVQLHIKPKKPYGNQLLAYRWIYVKQWYSQGLNFEQRTFENKKRAYALHELKYRTYNRKSLYPFDFNLTGEISKGYVKLSTQYAVELPYPAPKKQAELYFFGGIQASKSNQKIYSSFLLNGIPGVGIFQRDYKMDELLFGRSEQSGSLSNQLFHKDAGFKNLTNIGSSETWMIAGSFRTTLPGFIPLRPYVQAALVPGSENQQVQLLFSSGLSLVLVPRIFEVYFPAFESKQITSGSVYQDRSSYLKKCSFMFNIKLLNPFNWLDQVAR